MKKILILAILFLFIGCEESSNDVSCDPNEGVIVQGMVVDTTRVVRWESGCIRSLDLKSLGLTESDCLSELAGKLGSLETLELDSNNIPELDLTVLEEADNIKRITMSGSHIVTMDLTPLADKIYLNHLDLNANPWDMDLTPLQGCRNLHFLRLGIGDIDSLDLTPLEDHDDLSSLVIGALGLEYLDLSSLASCDRLKLIAFGFNNLNEIDLSPLAYCHELEGVFMGINRLEFVDLTPLDTLPNLVSIGIESNLLTEEACNHVCNFISTHPDIHVEHDCGCD